MVPCNQIADAFEGDRTLLGDQADSHFAQDVAIARFVKAVRTGLYGSLRLEEIELRLDGKRQGFGLRSLISRLGQSRRGCNKPRNFVFITVSFDRSGTGTGSDITAAATAAASASAAAA